MCESRLFTTESLHGPLLAVPCEGALADVNCDTQAINGRYTARMADEPAVWGVLNDWRLRGDTSRQGIITEPVTRVWRFRGGAGPCASSPELCKLEGYAGYRWAGAEGDT